MVDVPQWEHARCRDWSKTSFPFEGRLSALRSLVRALRRAHDATLRVGRALSALRARWPEGAREGLKDLKGFEAQLDANVRHLRDRIEKSGR